MKTRINLIAALMLAALALSSVVTVSRAADTSQSKPISKKELKVLLKTAKEPPEHLRIAEYYRQQAAWLNAEAKEHEGMAEEYAKRPPFPAMQAKHGDTVPGVGHCRKWAELNADEAKEAEALAALHEDMAKAAEQKQ